MRITLVQPPSNRYDTSELAPPVSLLSVAAVLEEDDVDVSLVDLNVMGLRDPGFVDVAFYRKASECIAATNPDVVGFTSMALESHICLELGRLVKTLDPSVRVVLGGPHFTAIAQEVLEFYPWVDYVIVGEGELPARMLLRYLRGKVSTSEFSNIAHRRHGEFALNREFKPYSTLNDLPFPAYHLVDLEEYFRLNPYRVLDIEHARGCALRCAFCYSPVHWGQGEQTKRIDRIVEDDTDTTSWARDIFSSWRTTSSIQSRSRKHLAMLSRMQIPVSPGVAMQPWLSSPTTYLDSMAKAACKMFS